MKDTVSSAGQKHGLCGPRGEDVKSFVWDSGSVWVPAAKNRIVD